MLFRTAHALIHIVSEHCRYGKSLISFMGKHRLWIYSCAVLILYWAARRFGFRVSDLISGVRTRIGRKKWWRFWIAVLGGLVGALVFAPPLAWLWTLAWNWWKKTPKPAELTTGETFLAVPAIWVILTPLIWENLKPDPPTSNGGVIDPTDPFVTVEKPDDLLNLNTAAFLESGFGGLWPQQRRKT